jgi:hypothetical protein
MRDLKIEAIFVFWITVVHFDTLYMRWLNWLWAYAWIGATGREVADQVLKYFYSS